jgi:hypothetical protein
MRKLKTNPRAKNSANGLILKTHAKTKPALFKTNPHEKRKERSKLTSNKQTERETHWEKRWSKNEASTQHKIVAADRRFQKQQQQKQTNPALKYARFHSVRRESTGFVYGPGRASTHTHTHTYKQNGIYANLQRSGDGARAVNVEAGVAQIELRDASELE